jgi:antitoxin CcdA
MRMNHAHIIRALACVFRIRPAFPSDSCFALPLGEPMPTQDSEHHLPALPRAAKRSASPKRAVNLSLSADAVDMAKKLGMNVSKAVDDWLAQEVKRRYWEQWREDNREAIAAYNARMAQEGLPLEKYRTF